MRERRRSLTRARAHVTGELELMPMLNVFIAIIPLLLLSAAFVKVAVIPTALPSGAAAAVAANRDAAADLTIEVRRDAYVIRASDVGTQVVPRATAPSVAAAAKEARAQLSAALRRIVAGHPGHLEVRIVAASDTRYEEIIDVMDVSREAGLPEAALADPSEDS